MNDSHVKYDVFISYNRSNSATVELLASYLANRAGLRVWMDKSLLQPGYPWRAEIEAAMNASASVLIAWGTHGLGPIQHQERDLAYAIRDSHSSFRVFYCLLPNSQPPQGNWANVDTWIRFSSSLDEADALANVVAAIKGEAPPNKLNAELPDEPAPFRGLAAFRVDDVKFFHGRSAYVDEMAERLRHHPFLSLLGPSGCGKTSLLQAGLAARLQADAGASDHRWRWLLLRPGLNPLRALALAVSRLSPSPDPLTVTDNLFRRLKMKPDDLPDVIQSYLPSQERLLLAVDRLEEVFILCEAEEERQAFLAALIALVRHPHRPAWVVTAMRADFYSQVGRYTELADEIVNHQVYLRPMEEREVAEIIEAPAALVGAIFEKGLAEQVRADAYVRGEVSLPLLQHALDLLWRKRRGRWLTWDAYSEMGRVAGALRYHADRVVEGLNPMERETARRIFIRLIWLDETTGTMAGRRTGKAALINQASPSADDERVLQLLADERLVVLRGHGEQATAELIHDTLPLNWELLRGWVQEDRDFLLWQQRLRADFAEWERMARDEGGLLRGRSLNEAERWLVDRQADLNPKEREFIDRSLALRQQELSARERLRRRITFGLAAGLLIALALAGLALNQTRRANLANNQTRARRLADQAVFLSESQLDLALLLGSVARDLDPNEASNIYLPRLQFNPHLLSYLYGHRDTVTSVAFHPLNSGMLASASDDGTVILWDVTLRQPLAQLLGGASGQIWCMAFSPDGKMLVTGGQDGAITSWDVSSRPPTASLLTSQGQGVLKLAFSQDGRTLAAGLADGKILLWDIAARRMLGSLNGEANGRVYSVAFSPDGKMLAAGHTGNVVTIWDVHSRQLVGQPLAGHEGRVMSVAFSPDGKVLASGGFDRKIIFWEIKPSGQAEKLCVKEDACKGGILSMVFHPDGKRLATSDAADGVTLWKVEDIVEKSGAGEKLDKPETFNLHTNWVMSLAFSPDGKMLASASRDQTIILWNLPEDHKHLTVLSHPEPVLSVAFSSDGKTLASSSDTIIRLWNAENHEPRGLLTGHQDEVLSVAFIPRDGKLLASGSKDGSVILWDTEKLERLAVVEERRDGWVWSVAFSPDGKLLAAGGTDLKINLLDVTTRRRIGAPLEGHHSLVFTVAFSPDNRTLASGSDDGEIILWDVTTGTRKASFQPDLYQADQDNSVLSLAFSPDGKTLASGYRDKTIILWDVQTQRPTLLKGHKDSVRSLAFSPDGKLLASGDAKAPGDESNSRSDDSDVILWNLASLQPSRLNGHSGGTLSLAFSPNQKKLASGGEDRTVILWDVGDNRIKDACLIANRNLTQGEWTQYVGSMPYKLICPDLPPNGVAAFREKIQAR